MSFVGNLVQSVGSSLVKSVAPTLTSIASSAITNIAAPAVKLGTDTFLDKGADLMKAAADTVTRLVDPYTSLLGIDAGKLLNDGIDSVTGGLKDIKNKGIDQIASELSSFIQDFVKQPATVNVDGQNVTVPNLEARLNEFQQLLQQFASVAGAPGAAPASTSSAAPASTSSSAPATTSAAPSTSSSSSSSGASGDSFAAMADRLKKPAMPGENADEKDMIKYQEDMEKYNRMISMLTAIMKAFHEMMRAVIQNFK